MKIIDAEETADNLTASVEFPDGTRQTVVLPPWASKKNIKDEAKRLQDAAKTKSASKKERKDLVD